MQDVFLNKFLLMDYSQAEDIQNQLTSIQSMTASLLALP